MNVEIRESYYDLINSPRAAALTTLMPDGQSQSGLVWCDDDGECARVNTTLQRQKGRNMLANPKVSLLIVDPDGTSRYLEIRGEAGLIEEGALEHLGQITRQYISHPQYCGCIYPPEQRARETRVICRIHAR